MKSLKGFFWEALFPILVGAAGIGVLIAVGCVACEAKHSPPPRNPSSVEETFTFQGVINKICLEGHSYYMWVGFHKGGLAPVLNDDGTPVKCAVEKGE